MKSGGSFTKYPLGIGVGTFQKNPAFAWWVFARQIVSKLTMNSHYTHWVNAPSPPVDRVVTGLPGPTSTSMRTRSFNIHLSNDWRYILDHHTLEHSCTQEPRPPSSSSSTTCPGYPPPLHTLYTGDKGQNTQQIHAEQIENTDNMCLQYAQ